MKEIEHHKDYIQTWEEFTQEEFREFYLAWANIMKQAETDGLSRVGLKIRSTLESYEDSPGSVSVSVWGERPLNWIEVKAEEEQERIQALADQMKISFYEAATVDRLQKAGKVEVK